MRRLGVGFLVVISVAFAVGERPSAAEEKPRLAVLDFFPVGHTSKQASAALADKVTETLQNTGRYRLINRTAVRQRMDERDWAITSAVDQTKRVTQLGKELDAAWIVWGRYTDMGRVWSLTLFMVKVTTGEQAGVVTEDVQGDAGDLLKQASQTAHRLLMQIGRGGTAFKIPGFPDLPPVSLPPMPAGVDELDARLRQIKAVDETLRKLRRTHTKKHPHVIFYRDKLKELAKVLLADVKDATAKLDDQYQRMRVYYKPAHPAMQAIERRYTGLKDMLGQLGDWSGLAPKAITIDLGGGVTLKLVRIEAGTFAMGSPASEKGRDDDEGPQHEVTISKPFYLGVTEVTQAQWKAVMGTEPWAGKEHAGADPQHAVNYVSWNDCQDFIRKLNAKVRGGGFRLPTEAEWEYACRAGSRTRYYFGDDESRLGDYAWYYKNAVDIGEKYAHAVGRKKPNAWGLYDMHGNVWEWCEDRYGPYGTARATDPTGPATGSGRVVRGGSFGVSARYCRAAFRNDDTAEFRWFSSGFRLVCVSRSGPGRS